MVRPGGWLIPALAALLVMTTTAQGCSRQGEPPGHAAGSGDDAFRRLASEILEFTYKRDPSNATYLGIHKYDNIIRDYSATGVKSDVEAIKSFQGRLNDVDTGALSLDAQLDLEQTKQALEGMRLHDEVIRPWAKDPDTYSSGITNDAYVIISRTFAPPEDRLKSLIARLKLMPAALGEARKNLDNPPRVYTEIAIEQLDGNRGFFETDVPEAFTGVKDAALLAEFKRADDAVMAALDDYKGWLQNDLLPRSNGSFAYGEDTYRKVLAADEMITTPLPDLLSVAAAATNRRSTTPRGRSTRRSRRPTCSPTCRRTSRRPRSCWPSPSTTSTAWHSSFVTRASSTCRRLLPHRSRRPRRSCVRRRRRRWIPLARSKRLRPRRTST
jgi:hypothetical protein